jgi:endoribonuclease Dicer
LSKAASNLTKEEQAIHANTQPFENSTRHLLTTQEFAATIHDPREYQIELYEKAKKENTIAVLDTGKSRNLYLNW